MKSVHYDFKYYTGMQEVGKGGRLASTKVLVLSNRTAEFGWCRHLLGILSPLVFVHRQRHYSRDTLQRCVMKPKGERYVGTVFLHRLEGRLLLDVPIGQATNRFCSPQTGSDDCCFHILSKTLRERIPRRRYGLSVRHERRGRRSASTLTVFFVSKVEGTYVYNIFPVIL